MLACAGRLKRIEIENFRVIRNLDLIVPTLGNRGSWLMFVGENGTGKTSILQAVQLALIAPCRVDHRMIDAREFLSCVFSYYSAGQNIRQKLRGLQDLRFSA